MGELWRLAIWGLAAAAALLIAAFASTATVGTGRPMQAGGQLQQGTSPSDDKPSRPIDAREGQRLAASIATLAEDRERLHTRITALERSVDNVAGSLARMSKMVEAAAKLAAPAAAEKPAATAPVAATPTAATPATVTPAPAALALATPASTPPVAATPAATASATNVSVASTSAAPAPEAARSSEPAAAPPPTQNPTPAPSVARPADVSALEDSTGGVSGAASPLSSARVPAPRSASDPQAKAEFGLDIGGGVTIEGLRTLWSKARQQHATTLEGLRPVVHLRESRRPGGVELRLVAGPLPSAAVAARLCVTLNAAGVACRPAVYDGQRLAAR
jgi:hypothetical protein